MFKLNNYLVFQLILLIFGQNLNYCAAKIQAAQSATPIDLELLEAALIGDELKVKSLINSGANINFSDRYGHTALIEAVCNGHKEIVELLIKKGADVNAVNEVENTALMIVASHANLNTSKTNAYKEILKLLLKAGTNLDQKNFQKITARDIAEKYGYKEMIEMLNNEPSRRKAVMKKWNNEILAKKINELTSGQLIPDISNIIAEYMIQDYNDLPLEYRLNN